jgi:hypothetical protein
MTRAPLHGSDDVGHGPRLLLSTHQTKLVAGLAVVLVAFPVIIAVRVAADTQGRLPEDRVVQRTAEAVRPSHDLVSTVSVEA